MLGGRSSFVVMGVHDSSGFPRIYGLVLVPPLFPLLGVGRLVLFGYPNGGVDNAEARRFIWACGRRRCST
jgi:hypothetical protein